MSTEKKNLRSKDWFGKSDKMGFVHRSWLRNQGYPDDYFRGKPVIGICNTWTELTPCNGHLRDFAEIVKAGYGRSRGISIGISGYIVGETLMSPPPCYSETWPAWIQKKPSGPILWMVWCYLLAAIKRLHLQ